MNTLARTTLYLIAASVIAFSIGNSRAAKQERTGKYADNAALTTKVKAGIFDEPTFKSTEINVESFTRVVQRRRAT